MNKTMYIYVDGMTIENTRNKTLNSEIWSSMEMC